MKKILITLLVLTGQLAGQAQISIDKFFQEISLHIDTAVFSWSTHQVVLKERPHLWFEYQDDNSEVSLHLVPSKTMRILDIELLPSNNFTVIDSLLFVDNHHFQTKIRFKTLTRSSFLDLKFSITTSYFQEPTVLSLRLLPTTHTVVRLLPPADDLFIGEEKTLTLETDNLANIRESKTWTRGGELNYKVFKQKGQLYLRLLPDELGLRTLALDLKLRKPHRLEDGSFAYVQPTISYDFLVKPAKLRFLNLNRREVTWEGKNRREPLEVELEYDPAMVLEKTYRVEDQEAPGGFLVAEIFTRSLLANGRVLCWLKLYDYHRRSDGYLYLKDGDQPAFITNMDITPATQIQKISLLREGKDWQASNEIYPGEKIGIKLEGEALHKASFRFDGLTNVRLDTALANEREQVFTADVPIEIREKKVTIYDNTRDTRQQLRVKDFHRPRVFDFIILQYGEEQTRLSEIDKLLFLPMPLDDIVIEFDRNLIDQGRLHGLQELEVEIEIRDRSNQLIDQRDINKLVICPGEASPRMAYYSSDNCLPLNINLNKYLRKKLFDQEAWTVVKLTIAHNTSKYGGEGLTKTVEFVLKQEVSFDIDVSFPAGLLTKTIGQEGFGNLGGISMAMIAQFSFYQEKRIAKAKPFKFGMGFLAFNAFNFDENSSNRDVGLVALASLYPIRTKNSSRLSFPLYMGGGYFLAKSKWFLLLGPGIRLRL